MAAQRCLQQPCGSSCVRRGTAHTAPCSHWVPVSQPLLAVMAGDSPVDGVRLSHGCTVEGLFGTKLGFILAHASPASLAAQHPACMRRSQIAICHCSSPRFPIRPFTWETKTAFKCFTSETPACNVLLKHFHHRNFCNLQSQQ